MTAMQRPVDAAMLQLRSEKNTVRELWIERAKHYHSEYPEIKSNHEVLYFTLPGAAAVEVEMLIESKLINKTETGAIAADSINLLVCLEADQSVYLQIQRQYSGLIIIRNTVSDFLHGSGRLRFPDAKKLTYSRARVVNLDLNETWVTREHDGEHFIPVLRWIQKFSEIHANPPPVQWTLLLTLHGECPWDTHQASLMRQVFLEAIKLDGVREQLSRWLEDGALSQIENDTIVNYKGLDRALQQKILMWLVPAMIAEHCSTQGWSISVRHNLRYGAPPNAPMVTWVIDFTRPEIQQLSFHTLYVESLNNILNNAGEIATDGSVNLDHL